MCHSFHSCAIYTISTLKKKFFLWWSFGSSGKSRIEHRLAQPPHEWPWTFPVNDEEVIRSVFEWHFNYWSLHKWACTIKNKNVRNGIIDVCSHPHTFSVYLKVHVLRFVSHLRLEWIFLYFKCQTAPLFRSPLTFTAFCTVYWKYSLPTS